MDENIYKITIAAFMHDIGKFAERANFNANLEFLNNNAGLYQPYIKSQNRHTHKHAVYTAAFIDHIEKFLPKEFNKGNWGLDDPFINLAAGHHKPETPLQWIIAMADRVSSGFDRVDFEDYNGRVDYKDYKKVRLLPLFEQIATKGKRKDDNPDSYQFRYPLKELSAVKENIFPAERKKVEPQDNDIAQKEYKNLFDEFIFSLRNIEHDYCVPLWFEHFDSLYMIYTSHIPAATVGKVVPDVSLYDHSRTTAALASALYLYHKQTDTMMVDKINDYYENKFLIINGDFYGIQGFIFSEGSSTNRAAAKLLRGRSFAVSIMSELAADLICREIGTPHTSAILNAAGKFTILAPNTGETKEKIRSVEEKINSWLINMSLGEVSIGVVSIEASCNDFTSEKFDSLWEELARKAENKKFKKIDLNSLGEIEEYLSSFDNTLDSPLCPFCGKRPSSCEAENDTLLGKDIKSSCKVCRDHIYFGTNLVKKSKIAITSINAELHRNKLLSPMLGHYQISFDVDGKLSNLASKNQLLKYFDYSILENGRIDKAITAKFISGYVPVYSKEDEHDNRLVSGRQSDKKKDEIIDGIKNGLPKSFHHISLKSLNTDQDSEDKFKGIDALGVLKADVDNLGLIFSCGLKRERQTLSRFSTMSRQMNNYFSIYIQHVLRSKTEFNDIYTVFAGGDDLFLIGPWNRIIEFSSFLNNTFRQYTCSNEDITISSGISINKASEPAEVVNSFETPTGLI